jgi:hypothetical protein
MKAVSKSMVLCGLGMAVVLALAPAVVRAADGEKESPTKTFMKKYHKAPKGEDTVAKKAELGKASPTELKELVAGYKAMIKDKPPRGDAASWKEKTTKLASAAEALQKGEPDAAARYKAAVD